MTGYPQAPPKWRSTLVMLLVAGAFLWAVGASEARWDRLSQLITDLPTYVVLMSKGIAQNPFVDPTSEHWAKAISAMVESLHMAWIGTLIGAAISLPLAFLAASNTAPPVIVFITRQFLNVIRAIPELILAIAVMLPIFGLGPLAGAMALGVGSIGTLAKLSSEAIEGIPTAAVDAARASGASKLQVLRWAVLPQVLPEIVAFWLYRFEINIRAGAILGALGAGGIGSLLKALFGVRHWDRIGITLLVVILITIVVDQISAALRQRIISGPSSTLKTGTEKANILAEAAI